jgi:PglZ domain
VVDGLGFEQWLALYDELLQTDCAWSVDQAAVFAWIPTITSVSRQAIFASMAPQYFPASIYSTDKEPRFWQKFWVEHGLSPSEVGYQKGLGELGSLQSIRELASTPRLKVLGLVVDKVDRIMHGMEMGMNGMHQQVRLWASEGFLGSLFDILLANGFAVFLTSDHGNIEAVGCGRPNEGAMAEIRGERVRIYSDELLRARVASRIPDAVPWPPLGLPNDFLPLVAPDRQAFTVEGSRTVTHGGITLDEIIVPFVRIQGERQ